MSPTSPLHLHTPTAPPVALHITSTSNLPEPVSLLDPAEEIVKVKEKPRPKFTLSTMSQQEKIDYGALIENLGGLVFDSTFFNPTSRHTIAGSLNRFVDRVISSTWCFEPSLKREENISICSKRNLTTTVLYAHQTFTSCHGYVVDCHLFTPVASLSNTTTS